MGGDSFSIVKITSRKFENESKSSADKSVVGAGHYADSLYSQELTRVSRLVMSVKLTVAGRYSKEPKL